MVAGDNRFRAGRLLPGGFAHLSLQRAVQRHPGRPKAADGGRGPVRREHDPDRVHHPGVAVLRRLQRHARADLVDCHGAADGRGQPLVQATPRIGHRPDVGRRRCWSGGPGSGLLAAAGQLRLDRNLRDHRAGRRRPHPGPDAVLPQSAVRKGTFGLRGRGHRPAPGQVQRGGVQTATQGVSSAR